MPNYIEIKRDSICQSIESFPDYLVLEHLLKMFSLRREANLPMMEIEIDKDDKLVAKRNGYYLTIADILGITSLRVVILNNFDKIKKLYKESIINNDIEDILEKQENDYNVKTYQLIYFNDKLLIENYIFVIKMFNDFVFNLKLNVCSIDVSIEENYILFVYKTTATHGHPLLNALYNFLLTLNTKFAINTVNGKKFNKY